jgi:PleD family two-component response regulator
METRLLPRPGVATLAEKLRTKIAETTFVGDAALRPRRAPTSIGVTSYKQSRAELFASADTALYRAKPSGKHCAVSADRD